MNPHGVVPTLVVDGHPVIQSNVIIEFLNDKFPEPARLKPDDQLVVVGIRKCMVEAQENLFRQIVVLSFNIMMKLRIDAFGVDRMIEWSKLTRIRRVRSII